MKMIAKKILEDKLESYKSGNNYNEHVFSKITDRRSTGSTITESTLIERDLIRNTKDNHAWRVLKSHRRIIGPLIVFVKKIVRKCLKWYIEPIADQQSEYNNATYRIIINMLNTLDESKNIQIQLQQDSLETNNRMDTVRLETNNRIDAVNLETNNRIDAIEMDISKKIKLEISELQSQNKNIQERYTELQKQMEYIQTTCSSYQDVDAFCHSLMPKEIKSGWDDKKMSYSQSGEDMIVTYILNALEIKPGSIKYLDLGANHAKNLSNTYFLYTIGARGVLVEANPALIPELKLYRGEDVVLNRCISKYENEVLKFYIMSGDGLSTSDYKMAQEMMEENSFLSIKETVDVPSITGKELMENYFDSAPDLLSIDIEGLEMYVLESIDLRIHRPKIIIVETIPYRNQIVIDEKHTEIIDYLKEKNYVEYAFTGINSIFIDNGIFRRIQ